MEEAVLERTREKKDLDEHITPNNKPSVHTAWVAVQVNAMLGKIRRIFTNVKKEVFLGLYKS